MWRLANQSPAPQFQTAGFTLPVQDKLAWSARLRASIEQQHSPAYLDLELSNLRLVAQLHEERLDLTFRSTDARGVVRGRGRRGALKWESEVQH